MRGSIGLLALVTQQKATADAKSTFFRFLQANERRVDLYDKMKHVVH